MNETTMPGSQSPEKRTKASTFWTETRTTFLLALPIIGGQLLQNSLTVIDTLMVGRVSVEAVAAASLATALFVVPLIFGFGVLGPFSVFVAGAAARGDSVEAVHTLRRGLALGLCLAIALVIIITELSHFLELLHQPSAVLGRARAFLLLLTWSLVPMYLFQTLKQYCEALHTAWPPMIILIFGVMINTGLNWVFIFGHFGAPALGLLGAGWATLITRLVMLFALAIVVIRIHFPLPALRHEFIHGPFHFPGYRQLLGMGLPSGFQVILEVGAFTFAAVMMGWISEAALAAHQVAISVASSTFMGPLGMSMAVAIRVSHAIGSNDLVRARQSIYGALLMTACAMTVTALFICVFSSDLAALFIRNRQVIALAAKILFIAGLFQIFDGIQVVCIGGLRGMRDVKLPTFMNFCGYWLVGLPLSYLLSFRLHAGPTGIWWGLLTGLALVAGMLLVRLERMLRLPHRPQ
jgi:MATE family multidrug resistance protein